MCCVAEAGSDPLTGRYLPSVGMKSHPVCSVPDLPCDVMGFLHFHTVAPFLPGLFPLSLSTLVTLARIIAVIFVLLSDIPFSGHATLWFNHSSLDGYLGCFHLWGWGHVLL